MARQRIVIANLLGAGLVVAGATFAFANGVFSSSRADAVGSFRPLDVQMVTSTPRPATAPASAGTEPYETTEASPAPPVAGTPARTAPTPEPPTWPEAVRVLPTAPATTAPATTTLANPAPPRSEPTSAREDRAHDSREQDD